MTTTPSDAAIEAALDACWRNTTAESMTIALKAAYAIDNKETIQLIHDLAGDIERLESWGGYGLSKQMSDRLNIFLTANPIEEK